jgi:hypothetical protein
MPADILLLAEGIAIATYDDDRSVQYPTLQDLLVDHGLGATDVELVPAVR